MTAPQPTNLILPPTSRSESEMSLRSTTLLTNLSAVTARIASASTSANASQAHTPRPQRPVRLVAVSKLKPASDIQILHQHNPTLHFGENYLQELLEKSKILPSGIRWHFIGGLQSNKCVTLARDVKGLWAVESVDSEKKASLLDRGWGERGGDPDDEGETDGEQLRVFVQVNTSGEENKSGVEPAEAIRLCRYIREKCPRLKLQGLMTIGAIARSKTTTPENENEDFVCLKETREMVEKELGLLGGNVGGEGEGLELSMGMSEDFEGAIAMGSNQVRIGSTIFGARPPKGDAKVV
ncbi:YggS family pyridoxal phosphate enzyme [Emergomyces pasteurianus Ep9510]|uniref:Pyridoxal phosphate homeostasis protein n=1 Tax=Emergomyces pasteurianus Ep9510 TaxID=1447872 RepID=A0A1J9QPM5_9EURO|nr:YggS family pyridoxal phosphate enzyme [Emergomyces pasteurianus Ep9510]